MPAQPKTADTGKPEGGRKSAPKRPARKKPASAVDFTIWSVDGTTLPDSAIQAFEDAIQSVKIGLFNDGVRVLSQTTRG